MAKYSTLNHAFIAYIAWQPDKPAERINDHILMSRGTSNAYAVTSEAGDVIINTGTPAQGKRTRERFEQLLQRPLNVAKILFTQSHPDHTGGWEFFAAPGTQTVVQREFQQICAERKMLGGFFGPRNQRVLAALINPNEKGQHWFTTRDPENLTLFADDYAFEVGGRRFEVISTPSGETVDSLCVWLPQEKTLFTGNFMGAIYGALPNFYTARGDRDRSVTRFLKDVTKLLSLQPELLITGHGEPIRGAGKIRADLTKLHDAVTYIHDETVKGMNAQETLPALMAKIALPAHLEMEPGRGPVSWYVRAVWEEYAGWFRHESTTELYPSPASAIWPELTELAGGPDALTKRAERHTAAGEPVKALHFLEIALAAEPGNKAALRAELAALQSLVDKNRGLIFDELGWLEGRILAVQAALDKAGGG